MDNCLKIEKMLKLGKTWKMPSGTPEQGSGRLKFAVTFNYKTVLTSTKNLVSNNRSNASEKKEWTNQARL